MFTSWEQKAREAALQMPLKVPKTMPDMVPITKETRRFLTWKSLRWMVKEDKGGSFRKGFLYHPFRYSCRYLLTLLQKQRREGDFFLYGVKSIDSFSKLLKKPGALLVVGFSFCHKPFECPSGRFSTECIHDPNHL